MTGKAVPLDAAFDASLRDPPPGHSEAVAAVCGCTARDVTVHQRVPDEFTNETVPAVLVVANINLASPESKGATPYRASFTVQTMYRGRSMASLQSIMGQAFQRLQKVTLSVAGFTVSECTLLTSDVGGEADEANLVHVGRQTFEIIVL